MSAVAAIDPEIQKLMTAAQPDKPNIITVIMGPQDVGKSVLAATVSKDCPEILPANGTTELTDIAWMGVDKHSMLSLRSMNLSVKHAVDFAGMLGEGSSVRVDDMQKALNLSIKALSQFVLRGGCKFVVVDTISILDTYFMDFVGKTANGPAVYGNVMKMHTQLANALKTLPAQIIYLSHEKAVLARSADGKAETVAAKKEYQEQEGLEDGDLDIAMYFNASKTLYLGDCPLQLEIRNDYTGIGNKGTQTRKVYTQRRGARTKNKFRHLLGAEEEPNLRKIFLKAGII